jgi:hypothetical protein
LISGNRRVRKRPSSSSGPDSTSTSSTYLNHRRRTSGLFPAAATCATMQVCRVTAGGDSTATEASPVASDSPGISGAYIRAHLKSATPRRCCTTFRRLMGENNVLLRVDARRAPRVL